MLTRPDDVPVHPDADWDVYPSCGSCVGGMIAVRGPGGTCPECEGTGVRVPEGDDRDGH